MTPIRLLAPSVIALALASCAAKKTNDYDTANPYGTADTGPAEAAPYQPAAAANPTYDTPAAYEETTGAAPAPAVNLPPAKTPATSPTGPAIIHTVVAGDTLSGISAKYKVPAAEIASANKMTKDTVVLGKKMVIPPAR